MSGWNPCLVFKMFPDISEHSSMEIVLRKNFAYAKGIMEVKLTFLPLPTKRKIGH